MHDFHFHIRWLFFTCSSCLIVLKPLQCLHTCANIPANATQSRKRLTPAAFVIDRLLPGSKISRGGRTQMAHQPGTVAPPPRQRLPHTGCDVGGALLMPGSNQCSHSAQACSPPPLHPPHPPAKVMSPVVYSDIYSRVCLSKICLLVSSCRPPMMLSGRFPEWALEQPLVDFYCRQRVI